MSPTEARTTTDPRPAADGGPGEEPGLGELLSAVASDIGALVRDELELARIEMTDEAKKAGRAAAMLGATGLCAHLALMLLAFAAAWGLAAVMPTGLAFLIVGVAVGLVAAVLYRRGRAELRHVNPKPEQTIETIKEDVQWAGQQTR